MKKQLAIAVALMAAGSASMAIDVYSPGDTHVIQAGEMAAWQGWCATTSLGGSGSNVIVNLGSIGGGWEEGGAYYTFKVSGNTTTAVSITAAKMTGSFPTTGTQVRWNDLGIFVSRTDPSTTGPTTLNPMTDAIYDGASPPPPNSWQTDNPGGTTATAWSQNYQYFGGASGYGTYIDAVLNYSSNIQNINHWDPSVAGGVLAAWNEATAQPSDASVLAAPYLYDGLGLGRPLKDQVGTFSGTVLIPDNTSDWFVTVYAKGGFQPEGNGSFSLNGLTFTVIPEPASLGLLALGAMAFLGRRRK